MTQLHVSAAMFGAAPAASSFDTASLENYRGTGYSSEGSRRIIEVSENDNNSGGIREYEEPRDEEGVVCGCFTDNPLLKNWMETWNREAEQERLNASEVLEYDEVGEIVVCTVKDKSGRISSLVTIAPEDHSWHSFERMVPTELEGRKLHNRIVAAIKKGEAPESVVNPFRQ